jgi:hypothetical protein
MDLDYRTNIESISGFYDNIVKIKNDYILLLKSCNASLAEMLKQDKNVSKLKKQQIVDIYKEASDKQIELEKDRAIIINNMNALATYKILLENEVASGGGTLIQGFDTMSPQIMNRDSVTLYNLEYLQIFCKVLGIVIIIAIFF